MNKNRLESFPVLSDKDINKINEEQDFYLKIVPKTIIDNIEKNIKEENIENDPNTKILSSESTNWKCNENNLNFNIIINYNSIKKLYDEYNLALSTSTLALGMQVSCKASHFCEYYNITNLLYSEDCCKANINIGYDKKNLKKEIKFKFFIYLKDIKNLDDNKHANIIGTNLGEIIQKKFILEGDESDINIQEVNGGNDKPLWYFDIDTNDLNQDLFDYCKIFINIDNKLYSKINIKDTQKIEIRILWLEMYTKFIYDIIMMSHNDFDYDENYNDGSIGSFIKFYTKILSIDDTFYDNENMLKLYEKIKYYVQKQFFR